MASKYKSTRYDPSAGLGGGGGANPNNQLLLMIMKQKMAQQAVQAKADRENSLMNEARSAGGTMTKRNIGGSTFAFPESQNFTADALNKRASMDSALSLVDQIEAAAKDIGGGGGNYVGKLKEAKANLTGGSKSFLGIPIPGSKEDAAIKRYNSLVEGNVSQIYKMLSGDTGTLNEGDVTRAMKMFWQLGEGEGLKSTKISDIKNRLLQKKAGYTGNLADFSQGQSSPIPGSPGFQGGQGSFDPNDPDGLFA